MKRQRKLVLTKINLVAGAGLKDPSKIALTDFRGGLYRKILMAHRVIYKDKNRVRVLKDRVPTWAKSNGLTKGPIYLIS